MSAQNVKAFYEKLSQDEVFYNQIKNVKSKEDCNRIVKAAGYDFTHEEFDSYTAQLLEKDTSIGNDVERIGERELEAVYGGFMHPRLTDNPIQIYGSPLPPRSEGAWNYD
jgi:predicted ribosomally synthesized peptide with nif11-like leader